MAHGVYSRIHGFCLCLRQWPEVNISRATAAGSVTFKFVLEYFKPQLLVTFCIVECYPMQSFRFISPHSFPHHFFLHAAHKQITQRLSTFQKSKKAKKKNCFSRQAGGSSPDFFSSQKSVSLANSFPLASRRGAFRAGLMFDRTRRRHFAIGRHPAPLSGWIRGSDSPQRPNPNKSPAWPAWRRGAWCVFGSQRAGRMSSGQVSRWTTCPSLHPGKPPSSCRALNGRWRVFARPGLYIERWPAADSGSRSSNYDARYCRQA
ncbi:hypothetical protein EDC01DRAFT_221769 [Geopyxis carbonaria]|nr:hypothetical protein EDC01DRAFT_221769 [Geopyxis carbonaria]